MNKRVLELMTPVASQRVRRKISTENDFKPFNAVPEDLIREILILGIDSDIRLWSFVSRVGKLWNKIARLPDWFYIFKLYKDPELGNENCVLWENILNIGLFTTYKWNDGCKETEKPLCVKPLDEKDGVFYGIKDYGFYSTQTEFNANLLATIDSFGMSSYDLEKLVTGPVLYGDGIMLFNGFEFANFIEVRHFVDENDNRCILTAFVNQKLSYDETNRREWVVLIRLYYILKERNINCLLEVANIANSCIEINGRKLGLNNTNFILLRVPKFNVSDHKKKIYKTCNDFWKSQSKINTDGLEFGSFTDINFNDSDYSSPSPFTLSPTNWVELLTTNYKNNITEWEHSFIKSVMMLYCIVTGETEIWKEKRTEIIENIRIINKKTRDTRLLLLQERCRLKNVELLDNIHTRAFVVKGYLPEEYRPYRDWVKQFPSIQKSYIGKEYRIENSNIFFTNNQIDTVIMWMLDFTEEESEEV
jgi:hypothetical protein